MVVGIVSSLGLELVASASLLEAAAVIALVFGLFGAAFSAAFTFELVEQIIELVRHLLLGFLQDFDQTLGLFGVFTGEIRDGVSFGSCTARTSNAVHVIFALSGEIEI